MQKPWIDKLIFPLALALAISVVGMLSQRAVATQAAPAGTALPIVMYHHILKEQARLNKYTISPAEFRADMQYLKDNGYTPIFVADLLAFTRGEAALPARPVMITFDDGYESFHEYAFPILKEYGFKSVFSVVGVYADLYSTTDDHHIRYSHCTWNQLALLQESGLVEVQNHSYNLHLNTDGRHGAKMKQGEAVTDYRTMLTADLTRLQTECAENLGVPPTAFTYPFGQISKQALPILKELGFSAAFTCEEKINHLTGDPEELYHLMRFNRPHDRSFESILRQACR